MLWPSAQPHRSAQRAHPFAPAQRRRETAPETAPIACPPCAARRRAGADITAGPVARAANTGKAHHRIRDGAARKPAGTGPIKRGIAKRQSIEYKVCNGLARKTETTKEAPSPATQILWPLPAM